MSSVSGTWACMMITMVMMICHQTPTHLAKLGSPIVSSPPHGWFHPRQPKNEPLMTDCVTKRILGSRLSSITTNNPLTRDLQESKTIFLPPPPSPSAHLPFTVWPMMVHASGGMSFFLLFLLSPHLTPKHFQQVWWMYHNNIPFVAFLFLRS